MNTFPKTKTFFILFFSFLFFLFLIGVSSVFAEDLPEYQPLVAIPGLDKGSLSIPDFVNAVYKIVIGLGALFGVIKIALAGVKYSTSDIAPNKAAAKKDILGVLLGLAILLMPYIVLNAIYPGLLNLDFTKNLPSLGENRDGGGGGGLIDGINELEDGQALYQKECSFFEFGSCLDNCKDYVSNLPTFESFAAYSEELNGKCFVSYNQKSNDDYDGETITQSVAEYCSTDVSDPVCKNVCIEESLQDPQYLRRISLEIKPKNETTKQCVLVYEKKV